MPMCERDNPADRLRSHALEDFGRDLLGRMVIRVLENCPNGKARPFDQPRSRYFSPDALDIGAFAPIDHNGLC